MEERSTPELFAAALAEARDADAGGGRPALAAVTGRPTPEVLERAMRMSCSVDTTERELGVVVLSGLAAADGSGRRPFRARTVAHLRRLLGLEDDSWLLGLVVSGLGAHRGGEALADVVALAAHPDDGVRYRVAAVLPDLVVAAGAAPGEPGWADAVDALRSLCRDEDPDVRYYALGALIDPRLGVAGDDLAATIGELVRDEDELIRTRARDHLISLPSHHTVEPSQ